MFFKIIPISNMGDFIALYYGHRSLSLPQTWLLFRHGVLLLPTCLLGLESSQELRWGKQNDTTACCHQLHPRTQVLQQEKCLRYPPEHVSDVIETKICVGGKGAGHLL